jgi:hypothetical protein
LKKGKLKENDQHYEKLETQFFSFKTEFEEEKRIEEVVRS